MNNTNGTVLTGLNQSTVHITADKFVSSSKLINAGALVYSRSTKRFLFVLRNANKRYRSTWGLPGGRIENNELPSLGLLREIKEELSIDLSHGKLIPLETFTSDTQLFVYHTYVLVVDNEFVPNLNEEHRGYAWLHLEDYPKPLHPGVWKTVSIDSVIKKISTLKEIFS